MGILFAFAPFAVFAVLNGFTGAAWALGAATAVSAALILRDLLQLYRQPKFLEMGTFVLLSGLTAYTVLTGDATSALAVRGSVDAGLLLIILLSMALGHPFTIQYLREKVSPETWYSRRFLRMNYVLTGAWAAAFAVMVSVEITMLVVPGLSHRLGALLIAAALLGALRFSYWYPTRDTATGRPRRT